MKKILLTLIVLLTAVSFSANAQDDDSYKVIYTLYQDSLYTKYKLSDTFRLLPYTTGTDLKDGYHKNIMYSTNASTRAGAVFDTTGVTLHVGTISYRGTVNFKKYVGNRTATQFGPVVPMVGRDTILYTFELRDFANEQTFLFDCSAALTSLVHILEFTTKGNYGQDDQSLIMRGGRYLVNEKIEHVYCDSLGEPSDSSYILRERHDTVTIYDEPSVRYKQHQGNSANFTVYFNTGYPYNPDTLTGDEVVYYALLYCPDSATLVNHLKGQESDEVETLLSGKKRLINLKYSSVKDAAGLDSIRVTEYSAEPGWYAITLKSDWKPANSNRIFEVKATEITTGIIEMPQAREEADIEGIFSLDGRRLQTPQRGINIVRYTDGTSRKLLIK